MKALLHERCKVILADLRDTQELGARGVGPPRGILRISLSTIGYRFPIPVLPEFLDRYPEIEPDLDCAEHCPL